MLVLSGLAVLIVAGLAWARYRAETAPPLPVFGEVSGFEFTDQTGRSVSAADLRGRVWLADLIFTRCPGPCLVMTRNLARLQERIASEAEVRIVSLTADPEFDTPEVLSDYAARAGADPRRWHFLSGDRAEINRVATSQLLLAVQETDPAEREDVNDLYLHSTKWVLVDRQGRLRGVYEGTDRASVRAAERDIRRLLRERPS